jgi:hypothetical protein
MPRFKTPGHFGVLEKNMAEQSKTDRIFADESADALLFKLLPYQIRARINEFTGAEFKVWIYLLTRANFKHGRRVWAGKKLIMEETGLSEHGVRAAIAGLLGKGWITRCQMVNRETGRFTSASTWCKWAPTIKGTHWSRIEERVKRP